MDHDCAFWIEAGFTQAVRYRMPAIPPCKRFGQTVNLSELESQRFPYIPNGTARPIADDRRSNGRTVTSILFVHVLNHFFAPLMLEVDIDIRRFLALA